MSSGEETLARETKASSLRRTHTLHHVCNGPCCTCCHQPRGWSFGASSRDQQRMLFAGHGGLTIAGLSGTPGPAAYGSIDGFVGKAKVLPKPQPQSTTTSKETKAAKYRREFNAGTLKPARAAPTYPRKPVRENSRPDSRDVFVDRTTSLEHDDAPWFEEEGPPVGDALQALRASMQRRLKLVEREENDEELIDRLWARRRRRWRCGGCHGSPCSGCPRQQPMVLYRVQ